MYLCTQKSSHSNQLCSTTLAHEGFVYFQKISCLFLVLLNELWYVGIFLTQAELLHCPLPPKVLLKRVNCPYLEIFESVVPRE